MFVFLDRAIKEETLIMYIQSAYDVVLNYIECSLLNTFVDFDSLVW